MLESPYILYPLVFLTGLTISFVSIPRIVYISKKKKLFDIPDNKRKVHVNITPNLGGLGIFFAFFVACSFFVNPLLFSKWNYVATSAFILFLTGMQDDLIGMSPSKKFLAQFAASAITAVFADIRISSLHGIFGIYELHPLVSVVFTVVGCTFVTNAINLIDGIDGLAGSIGVLCTLCFGVILAFFGHIGEACMAFALMGSIIGFLRFNWSPAKIFMGDTGSLLIGFMVSVLAILSIHAFHYNNPIVYVIHSHKGMMLVALSVLFVPVFDSFRVFLNRARKGGSPFKADRTHLHHFLLDAGYLHAEAVIILIIANVLLIIVALLVQDADPNISLLCIILLSLGFFALLYHVRKKQLARNQELIAKRNKLAEQIKDNVSAMSSSSGNMFSAQ